MTSNEQPIVNITPIVQPIAESPIPGQRITKALKHQSCILRRRWNFGFDTEEVFTQQFSGSIQSAMEQAIARSGNVYLRQISVELEMFKVGTRVTMGIYPGTDNIKSVKDIQFLPSKRFFHCNAANIGQMVCFDLQIPTSAAVQVQPTSHVEPAPHIFFHANEGSEIRCTFIFIYDCTLITLNGEDFH